MRQRNPADRSRHRGRGRFFSSPFTPTGVGCFALFLFLAISGTHLKVRNTSLYGSASVERVGHYDAMELLPLMSVRMLQMYYTRGWGSGNHLSNLLTTMHALAPNKKTTVIDCGAASYSTSGGDVSHAELAARLWKQNARIIGFEPGPEFTRMTDGLSRLREESGADIVFEELGVSEKPGTFTWYSSIDGLTTAHNIQGLEAHGDNLGEVHVTTLDQYTRENGVEHIHFLKVRFSPAEMQGRLLV